MNKVSIAVFLGCAVTAVGWLFIHERDHTPRVQTAPTASASVATPDPSAAAPSEDALDAGAPEPGDGGLDLDVNLGDAGAEEADAGAGGAGPLANSPKWIRFGAVQIIYAGAEFAPKEARSKEAAEKKAKELAAMAKEDFKAAVEAGDRGSTVDAGRMDRGIVGGEAEVVMFNLEKGAVSDPVDTPRGFWIIKRID